jgi:hypothetical protein
MKKLLYLFASLSLLLAACSPAAANTSSSAATVAAAAAATLAAAVPAPTNTPVASETPSPQPSLTSAPPPVAYGPSGFPSNVNPLTGLQVADPSLLARRPLLIKVSNLPRNSRPQWGLSLADIVFEYYTEDGGTRFAALFYGNNASMVGPIRSARFMDAHLIRGYDAVFAFGSAYDKVIDRLYSAEFANRLVLEGGSKTPLTRYDPNSANYLMANTATLSAYITAQGVENGRQNLDGMSFDPAAPAVGQPGTQLFVRYSGSIYNRWDYDASTGKYLRFSDTQDDFNNNSPQYAQSTDRLTGNPIAFDNVVMLFVTTEHYNVSPEVVDIQFLGSGSAYAFRDGQAYQVTWHRDPNSVVSLTYPDGKPFTFKSGTTWFEVLGAGSLVKQTTPIWQFTHVMP